MPHHLSYPARVPNSSLPAASSVSGSRRRRTTGRRALNVLALLVLVLLLPMQGPVDNPFGGPPAGPGIETASAHSKPAVMRLKLVAERVSTRQRAKAEVVVRPRAQATATDASQARSLRSGRVKAVVKGGGRSRPVNARLIDGKTMITLPRLPKGTYRVRATLLGNKVLGEIRSSSLALTVLPAVRVGLTLDRSQVGPGEPARASVRVSSARTSVRGKVSVAVVGAGGSWTIAGRVRAGRADVPLPALSTPGTYQVRAAFTGTRRLASGTSAPVGLSVVETGDDPVATPEPESKPPRETTPEGACLSSPQDPGGADPWGTCWPGPNNTGVPAGTRLTAMSGNQTIKTDGQVVDGWDVKGCINVEALNVTIKNSRAHCVSLPSGAKARYCHYGESNALRSLTGCTVVAGLSNDSNPATNDPRLRIVDSEIDCHGVPGRGGTGLGDRNMTVVRVDVHGCENGFDADSYMTITDSYIHDLFNSTQGDPHTDGLQSGVGAHLVLDHNVFYAFTAPCKWPNNGSCNGTAAINIGGQRSQATSGNTTVSRNLIAGGAYTMYCPILATSDFRITENHFSEVYSPNVGEFGPTDGCRRTGITSSDNVRLKYATGQAVSFAP